MSMFKELQKVYPYLISIRKIKNYISFDMSFPDTWKFPKKFIPENNVVEIDTPNESEKGISFISEFDESTTIKILENIVNIIYFNKEREEKEKLLLDKVNELKNMFEKQSLSALKTLKFDISPTSKMEIIDERSDIKSISE